MISRFSVMILLLSLLWSVAAHGMTNPVLECNAAFISAAKKETPPPVLMARNLAILHLASWRAVADSKGDDREIIIRIAAAGYRVSSALLPSQQAVFAKLYAAQVPVAERASIAAIINEAEKVANDTLAGRKGDGATMTVNYVPHSEPGQWRRTPPNFRPPELPHWGQVTPFMLEKASQFRPPPPPALDSPAYAETWDKVLRLGSTNSSERTPEQTIIAQFWSDFSYTTSPPGHWNDIARDVVTRRPMAVRETARLFAILNVAMADAGIACWEGKYHYNFWRPVTAIPRAGEDSNAATTSEPDWKPLLNTPPHPEYVSGHAAFSGAGQVVLEHLFATTSDTTEGIMRKFSSFNVCAEEIAASRVYGGIHYPVAGKEGLELGRKVGAWTLTKFPPVNKN
jgi:membrane-associated phospholipid phosphatase